MARVESPNTEQEIKGIDWIGVNWDIPQHSNNLTEVEVEELFSSKEPTVGQMTPAF